MLSVTLEVTACVIAASFGMLGVFYGESSVWLVAVSGSLVAVAVIYLSQLAEAMQKGSSELTVGICKVLNKLLYATIVAQVIVAALMV